MKVNVIQMVDAKLCVIAVFFIHFHPAIVNGASFKFLEEQPDIGEFYEDSDQFENVYNLPIENTPFPKVKYPFIKKWQVGRVSRKQYEIINMLWRRPNSDAVINIGTTTISMTPLRKENIIKTETRKYVFAVPSMSAPFVQYVQKSTTPSYIEFYYLDEIETVDQHTESSITKMKKDVEDIKFTRNNEDHSRYIYRSPLFVFRINEPTYIKSASNDFLLDKVFRDRQTSLPDQNAYLQNNIQTKHVAPLTVNTFDINNISPTEISSTMSKLKNTSSNTTVSVTTYPTITESTITNSIKISDTTQYKNEKETITVHASLASLLVNKRLQKTKYLSETTQYDKIKFFEVYDSHTNPWFNKDTDNTDNQISNSNRIKLENIYDSMGEHFHLRMKFAKKDVGKSQNEIGKNCSAADINCLNREFSKKNLDDSVSKEANESISINSGKRSSWDTISTTSNVLTWTEYPFIAVYFYERLHVHCDAAIFSSHWLLASAACLSRHRDDPPGEERTAYVTYCSDNWWEPDHINYVKQTLIHPKYKHKEIAKRHLYNIGVIQVVSSLALNCHGYAPVPVMSHDYIADLGGSVAMTIGFGLDRYATSYSANDLPKRPLSAYKSVIFSNTCPGNSLYRRIQMKNKLTDNVYCLSLPPYLGEKLDPVHGGILLVEGKLIGLYLQEERRSWGVQSAQYTSVWRLFPWVLNVAREPDDTDFTMNIEEQSKVDN